MVLYSADEGSFKGGLLKILGSKLQRKYRILTKKKKKEDFTFGYSFLIDSRNRTSISCKYNFPSNKIRKKFPDLLRFGEQDFFFSFPFFFC